MKPILIQLNGTNDWADYFEAYLLELGVPHEVVNCGRGDPLPSSLQGYSGFAIMGGAMSANDEATVGHLQPSYALLAEALTRRVPVIGHCLGGQLLAKALGGRIGKAPQSEVGWHWVEPNASAEAAQWLGPQPFRAMQWHYEAFDLPNEAVALASSAYCPNQAFVADGIHLGMQFHIEARSEKITGWLSDGRSERSQPNGRNIQDDATILAGCEQYEELSKAVARRIYDRWLSQLA